MNDLLFNLEQSENGLPAQKENAKYTLETKEQISELIQNMKAGKPFNQTALIFQLLSDLYDEKELQEYLNKQ